MIVRIFILTCSGFFLPAIAADSVSAKRRKPEHPTVEAVRIGPVIKSLGEMVKTKIGSSLIAMSDRGQLSVKDIEGIGSYPEDIQKLLRDVVVKRYSFSETFPVKEEKWFFECPVEKDTIMTNAGDGRYAFCTEKGISVINLNTLSSMQFAPYPPACPHQRVIIFGDHLYYKSKELALLGNRIYRCLIGQSSAESVVDTSFYNDAELIDVIGDTVVFQSCRYDEDFPNTAIVSFFNPAVGLPVKDYPGTYLSSFGSYIYIEDAGEFYYVNRNDGSQTARFPSGNSRMLDSSGRFLCVVNAQRSMDIFDLTKNEIIKTVKFSSSLLSIKKCFCDKRIYFRCEASEKGFYNNGIYDFNSNTYRLLTKCPTTHDGVPVSRYDEKSDSDEIPVGSEDDDSPYEEYIGSYHSIDVFKMESEDGIIVPVVNTTEHEFEKQSLVDVLLLLKMSYQNMKSEVRRDVLGFLKKSESEYVRNVVPRFLSKKK